MNKVVLIGRLTRDPELKFAAGSGTAISRFSVAINRQFKKEETDFINCIAFGKTAETISNYFTKGRQIALTGSIRTGSYDAQDGTKRYTTDVAVDSFEFVGSKDESHSSSSSAPKTAPQEDGASVLGEGQVDYLPIGDEDMPF